MELVLRVSPMTTNLEKRYLRREHCASSGCAAVDGDAVALEASCMGRTVTSSGESMDGFVSAT